MSFISNLAKLRTDMYSSSFTVSGTPGSQIGDPRLKSITYIQASEQPDWSFFMHTHDHALELSYVLGGRGALYCGGKYYELKPGTIVVKNPGIQHAENSDPRNPIEQLCLLTDGLQLESAPENVIPKGTLFPVIMAASHRELLDSLARDMLKNTADSDETDLVYVNELLRMILCTVINEFRSTSYGFRNDTERKLVTNVRAWIDDHYMQDLSLTALAEQFHFSPFYLSRTFKQHTGFTVNHYLISCRLGEAQKRLIFSDERIDEIAESCGFTNLSYFYTTFRKKVGCTPSKYKKIYGKTV